MYPIFITNNIILNFDLTIIHYPEAIPRSNATEDDAEIDSIMKD